MRKCTVNTPGLLRVFLKYPNTMTIIQSDTKRSIFLNRDGKEIDRLWESDRLYRVLAKKERESKKAE